MCEFQTFSGFLHQVHSQGDATTLVDHHGQIPLIARSLKPFLVQAIPMFCGEGDPPNTPYGHAQNPPGSAFDDWCGENRFVLLNLKVHQTSTFSGGDYHSFNFSTDKHDRKLSFHFSGCYLYEHRKASCRLTWAVTRLDLTRTFSCAGEKITTLLMTRRPTSRRLCFAPSDWFLLLWSEHKKELTMNRVQSIERIWEIWPGPIFQISIHDSFK